jgi:hypothetical protein
MSGILVAAVAVQCIAITNAFGMGANGRSRRPNYGSLSLSTLRWCEWTPLAGLMTFLAEAVDLPCRKSGIRVDLFGASNPSVVCSESSSVLSHTAWGICMTLSMVTYLGILPAFDQAAAILVPRGTSDGNGTLRSYRLCVLPRPYLQHRWTVLVVFTRSSGSLAHENAQRHRQLSLSIR